MPRSTANIITIPRAGEARVQPATKSQGLQPAAKGTLRASIINRLAGRTTRRINVSTEHMDDEKTTPGREPVDVVKLLRENAQLRADNAILQNRLKIAELRLNGEIA